MLQNDKILSNLVILNAILVSRHHHYDGKKKSHFVFEGNRVRYDFQQGEDHPQVKSKRSFLKLAVLFLLNITRQC